MNSELSNFIKQVNDIANNFRNNMMEAAVASRKHYNTAMEVSNRMRLSVKEFAESNQFKEGWENFKKGIIETEEDLKVFKYAMVELGYPPHHSLGIWEMREIARDYKLNKEELEGYIGEFLIEYYNPRELNNILLEWEDSECLQKRMSLLRNAIMAHNIGMYDLVIPSILSQLEGFLIDLFGVKGKVNGEITSVLLKHLLLENENKNSGFNFDDAIHKYYSEQVLEQFEHGKTMKYGISRHAILHGSDTDFGNAKTSIKVILLFDYLNYISNELSPESIKAANEEIKRVRAKRKNYRKKKRN